MDPVGAALAQELGDLVETRVLAGVDALATDHDRLGQPFRPQPLGRLPDAGVLSLAEHDARLPPGGSVQNGAPKAHRANRRASAAATSGCTRALTSPPKRATSRTRLELR